MKRILVLVCIICCSSSFAWAQLPLKSTTIFNGLYTMPVNIFLDSVSKKSGIKIIYETTMVEGMMTELFHNSTTKEVLSLICKDNNLQYWYDHDGVIYIIRKPEDVERLKSSSNVKTDTITGIKTTDVVIGDKQPVNTVPFKLSGRVIDNNTGESLPSAVIKIQNTHLSTMTNADGYFTFISVPADTCVLAINYIGYQTDLYALNKDRVKNEILIGLVPASQFLTEVLITGKKREALMSTDKRRVSVLQISPAKLEQLPNIGEKDILRSFQLMPGISASNESSSGAYVRGGTPDQNLVLFDGFTVYQVDHLYGFFSAFNSNAVKDVTLYKGGFSAKYGGRLSSVTDIVGKEGNSKEGNISGDLSLLSANVFLEKPIGSKSNLLLAFRQSYQGPLYNKIFNKFNSTSVSSDNVGRVGPGGPPVGGGGGGGGFGGQTVTTPSSTFYDFNAKYTYAPDDKNRFSWSIYQGNDNLDNSRDMTLPSFISGGGSSSMTDKTIYGNLGSSLKWSSRWSTSLYSNTLLSYSTYHSDRDNSNSLTIKNSEGVEETISTGTIEKNNLKDFSLKSDWEWQAHDKFKLLYGAFASRQNVTYRNSLNDISTLINQDTQALTTGGYAELEINPDDKLQFKPSLRSTLYDQTGKLYLEPRASATYTLTNRFTLKASTGRFYQFTNRVLKEDILSGSRDFWVLSNGNTIPVSSAMHYIAGFSYETKNFLFDVEGYYKKLENLSEYSQRQTGRRGQAPTLEEHFYNGSGYAKGIEFLFQKTQGKFTGWASYTLAEAINNFEVYGGDYFANQDTRHEFKLVNMYQYGKWHFSATWIYASGKPYTAPLTSYTVNDYTGASKTFLTISAKNGERMPAYHRLDAAVTYDFIKVDSRKTGSIGFSLFNIYNRQNIWYKQYTIVNNQVITSNVSYLGLTPNLTLSLKLK